MRPMGFATRWIELILMCVTSVKYSVFLIFFSSFLGLCFFFEQKSQFHFKKKTRNL
jgi:hypothetical protein